MTDLTSSLYHELQVFVRDGALYAFKGLAGRLGPIGVHASMLAIMGGVAWGGLSGWKGSAMAPQARPQSHACGLVALIAVASKCSLPPLASRMLTALLSTLQGSEFLLADAIRPASPLAMLPGGEAQQ